MGSGNANASIKRTGSERLKPHRAGLSRGWEKEQPVITVRQKSQGGK